MTHLLRPHHLGKTSPNGDVIGGIAADIDDGRPVWSYQEIAYAIERNEVTFPMLIRTTYLQWSAPEGYLRDSYRQLHRPTLAQFMELNGGIRESFYVGEFPAGIVLTGRWQLFSDIWWDSFKFDTSAARELESEINDIRLKAGQYLGEMHRRVCMERLLRIYKALWSSLRLEWLRRMGPQSDDDRAPHAAHLADIQELRGELQVARAAYERAGTTRGLARYSAGAAAGAAAIAIGAGLAAALIASADHTAWLGAVAGGALGGLFSVLERLTRRALHVRFESDEILFSGVSRPVVGAISGVALFALVQGTVVPLDIPQGEPARVLFFAGLGFVAGFSERFARDVFGNAVASLGGFPERRNAEKPSSEAGEGSTPRVRRP